MPCFHCFFVAVKWVNYYKYADLLQRGECKNFCNPYSFFRHLQTTTFIYMIMFKIQNVVIVCRFL